MWRTVLTTAFLVMVLGVSTALFLIFPQQPVNRLRTSAPPRSQGDMPREICFETDLLPFFQTNCAVPGCHDAKSNAGGYQLDQYTNIIRKGVIPGNAAESSLAQALKTRSGSSQSAGSTHQVPAEQKELILRWINEGAQYLSDCSLPCDTAHFAYTNDIRPLLQQRCFVCHGGRGAKGAVDLSDYAVTRDLARSGKLLASVRHQPGATAMPQNGMKLSRCQIRVIEKWLEAGARQN